MLKFILTALAAIIASYILPGVYIDGFLSAIILSLLLAILNVTVRPLLLILTIPATVLTFGVFIFVINAIVILICDAILPGFEVDNFWWALLFSIVLWLTNSLLNDLTAKKKEQ
jgi:putative membrane protein